MTAAAFAAGAGARVTLLERNEKLGRKIYITGKGRCNVTNACTRDEFQKQVVHNPRFLYSALSFLSPSAWMEQLETWGCALMVERGSRVFPRSQKASDVTRAIEGELCRLGVAVRLNTRVRRFVLQGERITGVQTVAGETMLADAVILCTGGKSYPATGSTGDGFELLAGCGHTVLPAQPALSALTSSERWVHTLQGLSLKNVRLTVRRGKKILFSDVGEMLFTHFGFSGPLILSASSYLAGESFGEAELLLDLKPGLTEKQLDDRLCRDIASAGRKQLQTMLCALYPARLAETVPALCGMDGQSQASELLREERAALVNITKELALPVNGTRPLAEAIVTRGGVSVREISPVTMESKRIGGLHVAGELLDVDALTGGFNLHIAFCTGALAGARAGEVPAN